MKTNYLSQLTDRQLDSLLTALCDASRILSLEDTFAKNIADEDFLNVICTKVRVFNEIQRRAKVTI